VKIFHYANFSGHDNDDEGAIAFALEKLGHEVLKFDDRRPLTPADVARWLPDFLLTHKTDPSKLVGMPCPKVFWYFDLIESDDRKLTERSKDRARWARTMTDVCDLGFMTDGDWVARDNTDKLCWLMQGADERVVGPYDPKTDPAPPQVPSGWTREILFTGSTIHGGKRISFVEDMKAKWGNRFLAFGHHPKDRVHGRKLAALLAQAKVVVCPDGPVTDRYCSNRLVQALGFGAFVTHPKSNVVNTLYGSEVLQFNSRDHLHSLVEMSLRHDDQRAEISNWGYQSTLRQNLYRHRCAQLVETVKARLAR
jgi:Glycosyl transferases group 1